MELKMAYMAPNNMLITAAMTSPPVDLLAVTTMAPIQIMSAQEEKVTIWNIPVPTPFISASPLLMESCLAMHSENDLIARLSPTNANTVLI